MSNMNTANIKMAIHHLNSTWYVTVIYSDVQLIRSTNRCQPVLLYCFHMFIKICVLQPYMLILQSCMSPNEAPPVIHASCAPTNELLRYRFQVLT